MFWEVGLSVLILTRGHIKGSYYQDQNKHLEQKTQDSTRIAEVQEMIFEAFVV